MSKEFDPSFREAVKGTHAKASEKLEAIGFEKKKEEIFAFAEHMKTEIAELAKDVQTACP